ncbi:protein FAM133B-like [Argopecten irradians]|uniref:protein FAM133B-like n=1 Tax=Argopecten irradians TaxID=31199 RepID=UPI00371861CF
MEEADKKKYWNKEIKSMLGPCMITFAIPLTVPGLTITLVAFSEDTTFKTYGVLHIVGILFLAAAIILLILGCMLRMLWKPFIGPDIEMHLTPLQSVASLRKSKKDSHHTKMNNIYSGARVGPEQPMQREENRYNESYPAAVRTSISEQTTRNPQIEDLPHASHSQGERQSRSRSKTRRGSRDSGRKERRLSESSIVQNDLYLDGSESESAKCVKNRRRKKSMSSQEKDEHVNNTSMDESFPLEGSKSNKRSATPREVETSLDEIQQWRQRKKSKQKSKMRMEDTGVVNAASDCDESILSRPLPKLKLNERSLSSNLENGSSTGDEACSGPSARSPHQSLLQHGDSLEKRKRRKKKRASKSVKNVISETTDNTIDPKSPRVLPPVLRGRSKSPSDANNQSKELSHQRSGSSDSINSIGSADSVLAQYTSRKEDV